MRWLDSSPNSASAPASPTTWGSARPIQVLASALEAQPAAWANGARASWSRRPRSSPTGPRRPSASPRRSRVFVAHPSFAPADASTAPAAEELQRTDLVVTSYGSALRLGWIGKAPGDLWRSTKRRRSRTPTRSRPAPSKRSIADSRIALTGTPVENNLARPLVDLRFHQPRACSDHRRPSPTSSSVSPRKEPVSYAPLRKLVGPYILRRLKTDKSVIADLPDKTEVKAFCGLTKKQAALYQEAVAEFDERLRRRLRGHGAARPGARVADALQANLQPSLAVAGRWRLGRGRQRQVRAADAKSPRRSPAAGEGARLHPVQGDRRSRLARFSQPSSAAPD